MHHPLIKPKPLLMRYELCVAAPICLYFNNYPFTVYRVQCSLSQFAYQPRVTFEVPFAITSKGFSFGILFYARKGALLDQEAFMNDVAPLK